ncbi:MAG: hypothetical protein E7585_02550 [Ruminococcaceae bacterium]|nr:hypothetical protein [Oscillospiraceae bacterium]
MTRFYRFAIFTLVLLLLASMLCACAGEDKPVDYAGEHIHTFGSWLDAVETAEDGTVTPAGQIRYCKICNAEEIRAKE